MASEFVVLFGCRSSLDHMNADAFLCLPLNSIRELLPSASPSTEALADAEGSVFPCEERQMSGTRQFEKAEVCRFSRYLSFLAMFPTASIRVPPSLTTYSCTSQSQNRLGC